MADRFAGPAPGPSDPTLVMEEPAFFAALGPVDGARVLDLGCGLARLGPELIDRGAASYLGVDGSRSMVAEAERDLRTASTPAGGRIRLQHGDLEDFSSRRPGRPTSSSHGWPSTTSLSSRRSWAARRRRSRRAAGS